MWCVVFFFLVLCVNCAQHDDVNSDDETAVAAQWDRLTFDTHEVKIV